MLFHIIHIIHDFMHSGGWTNPPIFFLKNLCYTQGVIMEVGLRPGPRPQREGAEICPD